MYCYCYEYSVVGGSKKNQRAQREEKRVLRSLSLSCRYVHPLSVVENDSNVLRLSRNYSNVIGISGSFDTIIATLYKPGWFSS